MILFPFELVLTIFEAAYSSEIISFIQEMYLNPPPHRTVNRHNLCPLSRKRNLRQIRFSEKYQLVQLNNQSQF